MSDIQKFIKENNINMTGYDDFKVGALIYELRKQAHLTQEELAEKLHT